MTSRSKLIVKHPRNLLQTILVARTWELGRHMEEISSVTLDLESSSSARHTWRAKPEVPALLAPHVDDHHFSWTAEVQWDSDTFESSWRIEPHALRESLSCTAQVELKEALGGRATQIAFHAELNGLDGRKGIETIAYHILQTNWKKLVDAAQREIEAG